MDVSPMHEENVAIQAAKRPKVPEVHNLIYIQFSDLTKIF